MIDRALIPHLNPQEDYREYVIVRTQTGVYGGRVVDRSSRGYLILDYAVRFSSDGEVSKPFSGYVEIKNDAVSLSLRLTKPFDLMTKDEQLSVIEFLVGM